MKNTNLKLWWKQSKNAKLAKYWAAEEIATDYYVDENDKNNMEDPEYAVTLPRRFIKTCWQTIAMAQILKKEMLRG